MTLETKQLQSFEETGYFSEEDKERHEWWLKYGGQLTDEEYYINKYKKWAQSGSTVLPVKQKEDTNGQEH